MSLDNLPINHVGLKIAYSTLSESIYLEICPVIGPSFGSMLVAPSNTNRFTPFRIARSMNGRTMEIQSKTGDATMKIAEIEIPSKRFVNVLGSIQSNVTPLTFGREIEFPDLDATMTWLPFLDRRGAIREDILPVPPVSKIVFWISAIPEVPLC